MKDTRRALRRHHRQRMIASALKSWNIVGLPEEDRRQRALRRYDNMQWCSCYLCGHRRKYQGPTIQELRQLCAVKHDAALEPLTTEWTSFETMDDGKED